MKPTDSRWKTAASPQDKKEQAEERKRLVKKAKGEIAKFEQTLQAFKKEFSVVYETTSKITDYRGPNFSEETVEAAKKFLALLGTMDEAMDDLRPEDLNAYVEVITESGESDWIVF